MCLALQRITMNANHFVCLCPYDCFRYSSGFFFFSSFDLLFFCPLVLKLLLVCRDCYFVIVLVVVFVVWFNLVVSRKLARWHFGWWQWHYVCTSNGTLLSFNLKDWILLLLYVNTYSDIKYRIFMQHIHASCIMTKRRWRANGDH